MAKCTHAHTREPPRTPPLTSVCQSPHNSSRARGPKEKTQRNEDMYLLRGDNNTCMHNFHTRSHLCPTHSLALKRHPLLSREMQVNFLHSECVCVHVKDGSPFWSDLGHWGFCVLFCFLRGIHLFKAAPQFVERKQLISLC